MARCLKCGAVYLRGQIGETCKVPVETRASRARRASFLGRYSRSSPEYRDCGGEVVPDQADKAYFRQQAQRETRQRQPWLDWRGDREEQKERGREKALARSRRNSRGTPRRSKRRF